MKSILSALQAGRLIQLTEDDKEEALRRLARILQSIQCVEPAVDMAGGVLARESKANTGIGKGWACPHLRVDGDGELLSAIGWSRAGIDYGTADKEKAHLLVMYCIPENQRTAYMKELSGLAIAIDKGQGIENLRQAASLQEVRDELFKWVSSSLDNTPPQAKARMIEL